MTEDGGLIAMYALTYHVLKLESNLTWQVQEKTINFSKQIKTLLVYSIRKYYSIKINCLPSRFKNGSYICLLINTRIERGWENVSQIFLSFSL